MERKQNGDPYVVVLYYQPDCDMGQKDVFVIKEGTDPLADTNSQVFPLDQDVIGSLPNEDVKED